MWKEVLNNLMTTGIAILIMVTAYLSNVAFSLWYNINVLKMSFEKEKVFKSLTKLLCFCIGLALLCMSITTLPVFANYVGWTIPKEALDIFTPLAIVGIILYAAVRYIKEAYQTLKAILEYQKE